MKKYFIWILLLIEFLILSVTLITFNVTPLKEMHPSLSSDEIHSAIRINGKYTLQVGLVGYSINFNNETHKLIPIITYEVPDIEIRTTDDNNYLLLLNKEKYGNKTKRELINTLNFDNKIIATKYYSLDYIRTFTKVPIEKVEISRNDKNTLRIQAPNDNFYLYNTANLIFIENVPTIADEPLEIYGDKDKQLYVITQ